MDIEGVEIVLSLDELTEIVRESRDTNQVSENGRMLRQQMVKAHE